MTIDEIVDYGSVKLALRDKRMAGPLIRRRRKALAIGLRELARRINVTASTLSAVEKGRRAPFTHSTSTQRLLADELGLTPGTQDFVDYWSFLGYVELPENE